jgi:hypothetical protein
MIIRHDRRNRESLVDPCKWPAITTFFRGNGAASLIAPTWLLTAAHVARTLPAGRPFSVELAEKRYALARVVLHPAYDPAWEQAEEDEVGETADLALGELATPVVNVEPYALYTSTDEVGQQCLLLGAGQYGDGLRGARGNDPQLRRATNLVAQADAWWLKFRFEAPPDGTYLEGVCGNGDSGGPAFLQAQDRLLLAGISSWQRQGGKPPGLYGCIEHYTRVSRFLDWIYATCATHN